MVHLASGSVGETYARCRRAAYPNCVGPHYSTRTLGSGFCYSILCYCNGKYHYRIKNYSYQISLFSMPCFRVKLA